MDGSLSDDWESFARPGESLENFHEERAVKEESLMLEELKEERNMTEFRWSWIQPCQKHYGTSLRLMKFLVFPADR